MKLTDEERGILDGKCGEPQRLALQVLVKLGEACGADRMVEIASAHLVASSYQIAGEAGIDIYSQLVAQGARVKVRTTSDPGSIDFARWREFKTPEAYASLSDAELQAKFELLTLEHIGEERSQALRSAILDLPEAESVLALTQLLGYARGVGP